MPASMTTTNIPFSVRAAPPLEIKLAPQAAEEGRISGLASTFGGEPDWCGDVIERGAFAKSLARHHKDGTLPAMLWCHDGSVPVGHWTSVEETYEGLQVEGQINVNSTRGREAHS